MDSLSFDSPERKSPTILTETHLRTERERVARHLKRAKRAGTPATLTLDQWLKILDDYEWMCAYCGLLPYHVLEHVRPIGAGGGTTAENCVPACSSCNNSKGSQVAIYNAPTKSFSLIPAEKSPLPSAHYPAELIYGEWLSEEQALIRLAQVSLCRETNIEVLIQMVCRGVLDSISTQQYGVMYRLKRR